MKTTLGLPKPSFLAPGFIKTENWKAYMVLKLDIKNN
jgi:hypothetical protein